MTSSPDQKKKAAVKTTAVGVTVKKTATKKPAVKKASPGNPARGKSPSKSRTTKATHRKPVPKKNSKSEISIGWKVVAGIIAAIILFVCWPYIRSRISRGDIVPEGKYDYCLDISHYQGKIQWDSLKVMVDSKGRTIKSITHAKDIKRISYVYIKATEGESMKDKHFDSYWEAAGKTDIWRGAYHFYRSSKDPVVQAKNFINTVGKLEEMDLPPVLDVETIHDGYSRKQLNADILKWLKTVENHYGVKPIVYTSDKFRRDILSDAITSNYKVWVAHYKTKVPWTDDWVMWQFTDDAYVCGMKGKADLSVIRYGEMLR